MEMILVYNADIWFFNIQLNKSVFVTMHVGFIDYLIGVLLYMDVE